MKKITIDPITRLEGHGRIEIFLNESGNVENAYLQVPEFRGFEKFCEGRPAEEMPGITARICGVCPAAHHMASSKALDNLFHVDPPSSAKKLRELFYCAHMIHSHIAHFYVLAGPDFIVGPQADPGERNILGVIKKVGVEIAKEVIKHRAYAQAIQELIGGKATHPVCGVPGGMSRSINEEERHDIEEKAKSCVEFALKSLDIFGDIVLKNSSYVELILGDTYYMESYYMGLVDSENRLNFYDGMLRVVNPNGQESFKFHPSQYLDYISEHVDEWSYLKFPYLKKIGWKGLVSGIDSGVYRVAPLARLNVSDSMATPRAQEAYEKMYKTLGKKPVHATLANHWARLIELLYASERLLELSKDKEVTSENVRNIPKEIPTEGVGVVEAPRGTLFHHYWTDGNGIITRVNLIVATGNNYPAICMSVRDAAKKIIKDGKIGEGLLNMIEMAFRAYDPCLACATHSLPGQMPMVVKIYDNKKNLVQTLWRG